MVKIPKYSFDKNDYPVEMQTRTDKIRYKINYLIKTIFSKQFIKFGLVGGIYTLIALLIYWYFSDTLHIKAVKVTLFWVPLSFIIRFLIEKIWVFKK